MRLKLYEWMPTILELGLVLDEHNVRLGDYFKFSWRKGLDLILLDMVLCWSIILLSVIRAIGAFAS